MHQGSSIAKCNGIPKRVIGTLSNFKGHFSKREEIFFAHYRLCKLIIHLANMALQKVMLPVIIAMGYHVYQVDMLQLVMSHIINRVNV